MQTSLRMALVLLVALAALPASTVRAEDTPATPQEKAAEAPKRQPVLWECQKDGYLIYLFGTIHVPDPRVVKLLPEVQAALDRSSLVFGELPSDPASMQKLQITLNEKSQGAEGYSFKATLGEDLYKRFLDALLPEIRPLVSAQDTRKVWYMTFLLVQSEQMRLGLSGQVLDAVLLESARAAGKSVKGLEKVDEQIAAFEALSVQEQVDLLEIGLNRMQADGAAKRDAGMKKLIDLYVQGDVEKIEAIMQDQATAEDLVKHKALLEKWMKAMLDVRNKRMADRLLEHVTAAGPGTVALAAVGTAHMPGDVGVLKLLEAKGFKTKRVQTGDTLAPLPKKPVPAGAGASCGGGGKACGGGGKGCGGGR